VRDHRQLDRSPLRPRLAAWQTGGPITSSHAAKWAVVSRPLPLQLLTIRYNVFMSQVSSCAVLRDARRRAGLTQQQLAARAGVTQSVISAYESGHRQPALTTLAALVEASGFDLDVRLRRQPSPLHRLTGPVGQRVRRHRRELTSAAAACGIKHLQVFGSVARGEDRPDSDVDLLADIPAGLGLVPLGSVTAEFERILAARVDLVPAGALKPDVAARIAADLVAL
jgi:uncharacterized protein